MRFREAHVTDGTLGSDGLFLGLRHELLPLRDDQRVVFQKDVQLTVDQGDVEAEVLGPLAAILTLATLVLVVQLGDEVQQLVGEVPSHVLARRISDVTDGALRPHALLLGLGERQGSLLPQQHLVRQHLVQFGVAEGDVLHHFVAVVVGVVAVITDLKARPMSIEPKSRHSTGNE